MSRDEVNLLLLNSEIGEFIVRYVSPLGETIAAAHVP